MKRKKIIPLVSLIVLMVLAMTSATIYYLNAGETKKLNNVVEKETTEENVSKNTDETTNNISTDVSKNKDNSNKNDVVKEKEIENESKETNDSITNSKSSTNNTTTTKKEETSISNNSSNKQDNQSSSNDNSSNNSNKVEEPKNNSTIINVPDEDNKDNVSSFENDEEYIKLKATLEFETRAECQAAADIIGPEYALQGNLRNTSCKSFAYKGTVIGYRLQIWFTDGTWIYNN